jgi:Family of unknown function (DUF6600)
MNVKKLLLGTVAASGVMIVVAASEPAFFPAVTRAEAAVNVSVEIGFNVFYERLGEYGDWATFHDRYVWVPRVDVGWRPYFHGHWVYTKTYGWYWLSDEPFAWAVYHYGRWAFDPEIGWYWIPARRWAPAWVVWSHTDDEIAWAPLPPDYGDDVSVSISVSSLPVYYWQAVPVAFFVSIDLDDHVIRDRNHIRRIVSSGEPKTVVVQNNVVVNNVIDIDIIEQKSKEKVVVFEEKPADSPEAAGVAEGNSVAVFNPQVKEEPQAKPAKLKKVEEVAAEKKASGTLPREPAADTAAPTQPTEPSSTEAEAPAAEQGQPKADQAGTEKKKQQPAGQAAEEGQAAPEQGKAVTVEEPAKKKKKEAVKTQEPAAGEEQAKQPAAEEQQAEQPAAQKKKGSEKALKAQPEEGTAPAMEGEQAQKPEKKQDQKKKCDPAVEDCAAKQ